MNDELANIQDSVAAPPLLEVARRGGRRLIDGEQEVEDSAMESLKSALEAVVHAADSLRRTATLKFMEVLRPPQSVKFLVAAARLQLRLRTRGVDLQYSQKKRVREWGRKRRKADGNREKDGDWVGTPFKKKKCLSYPKFSKIKKLPRKFNFKVLKI